MKVVRKVQDRFEAEQFLGPDHPLPFAGRGDPCRIGLGRNWECDSGTGYITGLDVGDWVVREEYRDGVAFDAWTDEDFKYIWQEVKA